MIIRLLIMINVGIVAIFPSSILAENLGVYGEIYSISEPDMLSAIHEKLSLMQKSGELIAQKRNFIHESIAHIVRPHPVDGVTDIGDQKPKSWIFNPSIVLNKSITNINGDVLADKGEKINPLKIHSFNEALLFIDGDNKKQIDLALKIESKYQSRFEDIKIILTNGDINTSAIALKQRVYFDQSGVLCKRFVITHTPTMVYQEIKNGVKIPRLEIREFSYD